MSITKAMEIFIKEANESLKRTPELLPVLKEVGVVDSGGAGLIKILDGMFVVLKGDFVQRNQATSMEKENPIQAAGAAMENEEFGYCTEFIMELGPDSVKKVFNEKRFINILSTKGNSLVVVRDENIVKVHIHTLEPGIILNYAQRFGEFLKLKIENMTEQHHALETGAPVEEHVDLVEEPKEHSKYALISVSSGEGITSFMKDIGISEIVSGGQTMNPSAEDFLAAIKRANAEFVYIFPNNSNIVMAANQAAEMIEDENVRVFVVPSKTIPQGITASIMFNPEAEPEENFEEMKASLKTVKSGEITFAIRDTDINGVHVNKDDFIGIMEKEIVVDSKNKIDALHALLAKMIDDDSSLLTLLVGQDVTEEEAEEIRGQIEEKYPDIDIDLRMGGQPVYSFLVGVE
jgi:DAK2 domain fusion protein YloV